MNRFLKYSNKNYSPLNQNPQHKFAQNHALCIYNSDAVYSFIPKNACSTLRTTVAYANGCIRDKSEFNWIHNNNHTFVATLPELVKAKYTFTVLRCPFSRLVSVYLDKIVGRDLDAWRYVDIHNRTIGVEDITFDFFVRSMEKPSIRNSNIHWRPQVDFLVYEEYDDYFALEDFSKAVKTLKERIGVDVIDARPLTNHGRDGFDIVSDEDFSQVKPFDLLKNKMNGALPDPKSLYSGELVEIVSRVYKSDIDLYRSKFGVDGLMYV